jgi:F-type H+-transporting ATPase subunit gamma
MANLKEIRTRLSSVKSTRQITSAMKMVSAAKLRRAQDAIIQMRPYSNKLQEILSNLTKNLGDRDENMFGKVREVKRVLLLVVTSNKGLCGAFNANIIKATIQLISNEYTELQKEGKVDLIVFGKKGNDLLKSKGLPILQSHIQIIDSASYEHITPIAKKIMDDFVLGVYDEVKIIYNQFKNAATQELLVEPFLPIKPVESVATDHSNYDFILEPSLEEIVAEIIPKSLKIQLFKAVLDSIASEHGARMTAMHKATDNASEMIKQLQLEYNKARQASITKEILEIVGGAEALK